MLIKSVELILVLTICTLIFILSISFVGNSYNSFREELYLLRKFYEGRVLIKSLTESQTFSNKTCNITDNLIYYLSDPSSFYEYMKSLGIRDNVSLEVIDISDGKLLFKIGEKRDNFLEFRRVCYYNGSLYLFSIKV
ncbi:hypothetical protein BA065_00610 [Nanoarchaeota archaeon NZ13-N]|uniref:Uncharacterized protein n=1 Tax=Candidatus Nanoclepta minutus TaxID=1940235 RepID=A0A397WS75_9ARCH|nr:MAG: hypothetical protein BA065_00610 [Nanoarchaeota archaeon NZ13-N]RIB35506.1 MAG: hypothetical protein BXU00_00120 [Candidatus Nanoclepta minutus]